jgi:hypothetical protein
MLVSVRLCFLTAIFLQVLIVTVPGTYLTAQSDQTFKIPEIQKHIENKPDRPDHDSPDTQFLTPYPPSSFTPGLRMLAPKTAFLLSGGMKNYNKTTAFANQCMVISALDSALSSQLKMRNHPEVDLFHKFTKTDQIAFASSCSFPSRSERHLQRLWVNYLLGNFITGKSHENLCFDAGSPLSNALKKSQLVKKTLILYLGSHNDSLQPSFFYRAHFGPKETIGVISHPVGIEHFIGSFDCSVTRISDTCWQMIIVNITSVTSADLWSAFAKPSSWLTSFPRSKSPHPYGNTMQIFIINLTAEEMKEIAGV